MTTPPRRERRTPPELLVDLQDPFGWMRIVAAMGWNGERQKLDQTLATYSAEWLGVLREEGKRPNQPLNLHALSRKLGIPPGELLRMPASAAFYARFFGDPRGVAASLEDRVFNPAGHYRAVAEAPGREQLLTEYARAIEGGAYLAGVQLCLVAMMAEHHPEVPASLNRAIAIMINGAILGPTKVPSDRSLWSAWTKWRHIAPLWAAHIGEFQDAHTPGCLPLAAGFEVLHQPAKLQRLLSHAKWFSSFAVGFVPEGAKTPLIPVTEALRVVANVPEIRPPMAPLPPELLAIAAAYRAPTRKFFP